jgi:hypothetical protein
MPAQSFREGAVVRLATENAFEKVGRDGELKTTFITEESSTYKVIHTERRSKLREPI